MAVTQSDRRVVRVSVSRTELVNLLGQKAREAGLIDFDPDETDVIDNGETGFEIVFTKSNIAPPA